MPQERARRDKEADAFAHDMAERVMVGFAPLKVDGVAAALEEAAEDLQELVELGGVTAEQLAVLERALTAFVNQFGVVRMSVRHDD